MRIRCATVGEFLECLRSAPSVYANTLRVSTFRRPLDDSRHAARFGVVLQVSAVVQNEDGSEYLLEAGEVCGTDYTDANASDAGTKAADGLRARVVEYAASRGWGVLPGVIEI